MLQESAVKVVVIPMFLVGLKGVKMPLLLSIMPMVINCGWRSLAHLVMILLQESAVTVVAMSMFLVILMAVSPVILT